VAKAGLAWFARGGNDTLRALFPPADGPLIAPPLPPALEDRVIVGENPRAEAEHARPRANACEFPAKETRCS